MRVIQITLGGEPTPDDVVCVSYAAKRGGMTTAGHHVLKGETLAAIAADLASGINTHWCQPIFAARAKENVITVQCTDLADDMTFSAYVEHIVGGLQAVRAPGGTETVEITED
jgi:hypothetical protein